MIKIQLVGAVFDKRIKSELNGGYGNSVRQLDGLSRSYQVEGMALLNKLAQ